ncbi:MAG: CBS domain-containing protein [Bryobacteraceae bacterium]
MARVREIVRGRPLYSVDKSNTVAQVARRMAELKVGAIVVLSGPELCGLFSERDLMTRVVARGLDPASTPVSEVMSTELSTVDESAALEEALERMHTAGCRHLPVMREGRVTGFLSMRDLMNYELARKTEELKHMRAYIQEST